MNKQEIVSVLKELHKITGFRVSLHGINYEEIAAYPEGMLPFCARVNEIEGEHAICKECDRLACREALEKRSTYIYKCRYGLTEAVSPLYNFDTLTGFLMMGQIGQMGFEQETAISLLAVHTHDIAEAASLAWCIPLADPEMVESYVRIMTICAQYLTLSNAITQAKPTVAMQAKNYIRENIDKKITIADICEELKCSKSTLLTSFKKQYGLTVNNYITEVKLGVAVRLLTEGDMTISEVAAETGFSDQSYFSKVFSAKYGVSPSEYRYTTRTNG
jgi:AraC-like DNA-binding protein